MWVRVLLGSRSVGDATEAHPPWSLSFEGNTAAMIYRSLAPAALPQT